MLALTRRVLLMLATVLLVGAAFLASREQVAAGLGLFVLAMLAVVFERLLCVQP